jgi:hypothetical protein
VADFRKGTWEELSLFIICENHICDHRTLTEAFARRLKRFFVYETDDQNKDICVDPWFFAKFPASSLG